MAHQLPKSTPFNTRVTVRENTTPVVTVGMTATINDGTTGDVVAVSSTGRVVTVLVDGARVKFTFSKTSRRFINMDTRVDRVATFA